MSRSGVPWGTPTAISSVSETYAVAALPKDRSRPHFVKKTSPKQKEVRVTALSGLSKTNLTSLTFVSPEKVQPLLHRNEHEMLQNKTATFGLVKELSVFPFKTIFMWNTNKVVNTSGLVSETRPSCWAQEETKEVMLNSSSHEEKNKNVTGEGGRVGTGSPRGGPKDRASRKLLPSRKSSGRRTGDRRAKPSSAASRWATSGGERRTKPVAASKGRGRTGQGGRLGSIQSKATARMKWEGGDGFPFRSTTGHGITETLQHSKS